MYFHTDSPRTARWLAAVIETAAENEQRLRLDVDSEGRLRVKRGEGVWCAPIESDEDPYRDLSNDGKPCDACGAIPGTKEYDNFHDSVNCWARHN